MQKVKLKFSDYGLITKIPMFFNLMFIFAINSFLRDRFNLVLRFFNQVGPYKGQLNQVILT